MCMRSRYFEYRPYRPLLKYYFDNDPKMVWTAAPKPLMKTSSYNTKFWKYNEVERMRAVQSYEYCLQEDEIFFDAADCLLIGDVLFVQQSMVTNLTGIHWLKRHFEPKGIKVLFSIAIVVIIYLSKVLCQYTYHIQYYI